MSEENREPIDEQQEMHQKPVEWYIQVGDGKKAGPISFERLKGFAERGKIQPTTNLRSTETDAAWMLARNVPGLYPKAEPNRNVPTEDFDSGEELSIEEPSTEVSVTDDSQAMETPRDLIDAGLKKDEKKSVFVIDTGSASKKKDEEKPREEAKSVEKPVEKNADDIANGSTVTSSPGIKISIGAPTGKKEAKKEKSSAGFKFKIDPTGTKPKEEPKAQEEPVADKPTSKKDGDKSASGVKISIGAPTVKSKSEDKSSAKRSSEKSASTFKVAVKPGPPVEPKPDKKKKSDDSVAVAVKSKSKPTKQNDGENTDGSTDFELKMPKGGAGAFLKIVAVLSMILAFCGAITLIALGKETPGMPFSIVLAVIVFLYGIMTGIVAWSLNGIVSTKDE